MNAKQPRNNVRRDPPLTAPARSDQSEGLTRREPMAMDRADTYTDMYNLAPMGGEG